MLRTRLVARRVGFSRPLVKPGTRATVLPCSTYCHYAEADGVHALLAGEVSEWPGLDMVAANHDGALLTLA